MDFIFTELQVVVFLVSFGAMVYKTNFFSHGFFS